MGTTQLHVESPSFFFPQKKGIHTKNLFVWQKLTETKWLLQSAFIHVYRFTEFLIENQLCYKKKGGEKKAQQ